MAHDPTTGARTSGMIALVPSEADAEAIGTINPTGEPKEDLHATLLYLGDDVTGWPPGTAERIAELLHAAAPGMAPIRARVMGHGLFNPDGGPDGDRDPCAVYLIGDSTDMGRVKDWLSSVLRDGDDYPTPPPQHEPWHPHVTAGYGVPVTDLSYTGPITFDRLRLAVGGEVVDVPLGMAPGLLDEEYKRLVAEIDELEYKDIVAEIETKDVHSGSAPSTTAPASLKPGGKTRKCRFCSAPATTRLLRDGKPVPVPVCAEHKDGKTEGKSAVGDVETKVMSPDPRAAKLREYWAHDPKGRRKWKPGLPGDFKRLRRQLGKYVTNPKVLNGLTANIHKLATGEWPGKRAHTKALPYDEADYVDPSEDLDPMDPALADGVGEWGPEFEGEDTEGYLFDEAEADIGLDTGVDDPADDLADTGVDAGMDETGGGLGDAPTVTGEDDPFAEDAEVDAKGGTGAPGDDPKDDLEDDLLDALVDVEQEEDAEDDEQEDPAVQDEEYKHRLAVLEGRGAVLSPSDLAALVALQEKALPEGAVDDLTLTLERLALAEDTLVTPEEAGLDEDTWNRVVSDGLTYRLNGGAELEVDERPEHQENGRSKDSEPVPATVETPLLDPA